MGKPNWKPQNCGQCKWWRPTQQGLGECRRKSLKAGESYREVRNDDPGCGEAVKGVWDRG